MLSSSAHRAGPPRNLTHAYTDSHDLRRARPRRACADGFAHRRRTQIVAELFHTRSRGQRQNFIDLDRPGRDIGAVVIRTAVFGQRVRLRRDRMPTDTSVGATHRSRPRAKDYALALRALLARNRRSSNAARSRTSVLTVLRSFDLLSRNKIANYLFFREHRPCE